MKLLVDVNISRYVAARLRSEGFEVVHVPEIMDPRAPDLEIVAEALRLDAVVVSHD
jgi:predicted nuclease of predicted toxin-antitoxin system